MDLVNSIKKISKIYRIQNWYHYLGFVILGFILKHSLGIAIFFNLSLAGFLLAYAYSLNDFYDKKMKIRFFLFPLFYVLLVLIFFNVIQIIVSSLFLFVVTTYSSEPFRFKAKPFISSICNGIGFSLLFLLGYFYVPTIDLSGILFFLLLFSLGMIAQFIHEVVHMKKDKINKIITTTVFLGKNRVKKLFYFFLITAILITTWLFYLETVNLFFVFSIAFFTIFFIFKIMKKGVDESLRKKYKVFGIIVGIFCCLSLLIR
jgi:4-hydroxybenzoate polyprenyltransferase